MTKIKNILIAAVMPLLFASCSEAPQPKPYAYYRIEVPPVEYVVADTLGPYITEVNASCVSDQADSHWSTPSDKWINLYYPTINATVHLSYKHITPEQVQTVTEESRTLVYKHTVRADAIRESYYENDTTKVYCVFYELTGNAASPTQFYATDSMHNFLRGSVYFNSLPNYDSIKPVAIYVENDIVHLIENLRWKN